MITLLDVGFNWGGVYALYVNVLQGMIYISIALSVVVAADRFIHVVQYVFWKYWQKYSSKRPEDYHVFADLPDMVSRCVHM